MYLNTQTQYYNNQLHVGSPDLSGGYHTFKINFKVMKDTNYPDKPDEMGFFQFLDLCIKIGKGILTEISTRPDLFLNT